MSVLRVGSGRDFASLSRAIEFARNGDLIQVDAGTYLNEHSTINKKLTIEGVGGLARFVSTNGAPDGKATFTVNDSVTFENIEVTGEHVESGNGSAIRHQGGDLVLRNVWLHDNQEGVLSTPFVAGTGSVLIENSEISNNAFGQGGQSHNLYIGHVANFTMRNSYSHGSSVGHEVKSRALVNIIENNRIQNNRFGTGSYNIDLPNGGMSIIRGNVIHQSSRTDNASIITFGVEGYHNPNSSLLIEDNTIINDRSGYATYSTIVANDIPGSVTFTGNRIWTASEQALVSELTRAWPPGGELAIGVAEASGNTRLAVKPTLDTKHVPSLGLIEGRANLGPDVLTLKLSENRFLGNYVSPEGDGSDDQHAKFQVSVDGVMLNSHAQVVRADHAKAEIAEFSYKGHFGPGQHVVAVHFLNKDWDLSGGQGRNLWVEGISLNGVAVPVGEHGTLQTGYNTVQAYVAPKEASLPGTPKLQRLAVVLAEDEWLGHAESSVTLDGIKVWQGLIGAPQGGSGQIVDLGFVAEGNHKVSVNFINDAYGGTQQTDRNLYVKDILVDGISTGKSSTLFSAGRADFDVASRAAYAPVPAPELDVLEFGISQNSYLGDAKYAIKIDGVQIGGVRTASALHGSTPESVRIQADLSDGWDHEVSVEFLNDAYDGTENSDRNLFVDYIVQNGIDLGHKGNLYSNGDADFNLSHTPKNVIDDDQVLQVRASADNWMGDVQFIAYVDGKQVMSNSVQANRTAGDTQVFEASGKYGSGNHKIEIEFTNDLYAGTADTDRNLFVNQVLFAGKSLEIADGMMFSNSKIELEFESQYSNIFLGLV